MKRWEIVKGIQEGLYPKGTRFKIEYPDGDVGFAKIDTLGCLAWDMPNGDGMVYIGSYSEDEWTVVHNDVKEQEEEKFVKITQTRLDYLEERAEFLNCLEAVGVDNWDGYGEAHQMLRDEE